MPAHSSGAAAAGSRPVRDGEHVVGVHDDVRRVAALSGRAVPVGSGVRRHAGDGAVLLVTVAAVVAFAAGVDEAADADTIADLVLGDVGTGFGDDPDDLVPRNDRVRLASPVAVDGVDVGVTNAGVLDVDEDVVGSDGSPLDGDGGEWCSCSGCCVGVDLHEGSPSWVVITWSSEGVGEFACLLADQVGALGVTGLDGAPVVDLEPDVALAQRDVLCLRREARGLARQQLDLVGGSLRAQLAVGDVGTHVAD